MTAFRSCVTGVAVLATASVLTAPAANADNRRLNNSVVANVYTMQHKAGCDTDIKVNPKLRLAAQWHTNDVLNNRALTGHRLGRLHRRRPGPQRRLRGEVAETVAINPALAISGIELIKQWFHRPDYHAIMSDCSNVDIGVWSENVWDRTVVVAVYGKGDGAAPVPSDIRDFGQVPGWTP
jgi:hypothetical protein